MQLADFEVWHSRSIAPTRRVALGRRHLPVDPAPGFGGLLLGAVVASAAPDLDPDMADELVVLMADLGAGRRIAQPRLRHRFQTDRHGLARTEHRLVVRGEGMELVSDGEGSPASQAVAAAYAAGALPRPARHEVLAVLRRALHWRGSLGPALYAHLTSTGGPMRTPAAYADPEGWALGVLGLDANASAEHREVQRAFRLLLRDAHPDHGAAADGAAERIADLREARRILLTTSR
jgi:hypothetical protein